MENLTLLKFSNLLKKNSKLISIFTITGLALGILYSCLIFKPVYKSTVKLLIKDVDNPVYISLPKTNALLQFSTTSNNSMLTQIQIITSNKLANDVWTQISQKHRIYKKQLIGIELMKKSIIVKNPTGTNIIAITASWHNPDIARDIAEIYKKAYINSAREMNIVSSISIIDNPIIKYKPAFPSKSLLSVMFGILSAFIATIFILVNYLLKNILDSAEELENILQTSILGVLPWLKKDEYYAINSTLAIDDNSSYYSLALQKIVTNINIRGCNTGVKTLTFTSSGFLKSKSTMLLNIAYGLYKSGNSVVVIDADFRTPSVHQEFNIPNNEKQCLAQLLTAITHELNINGDFNEQILNNFIQEITKNPGLHIITNNETVPDPYEFLNSNALGLLIEKLKEKYDWVLIDTPPALAVPDTILVSSHTNGVLISTGLDTPKSNIKNIYKLFNDNRISIFGVIVREFQPGEISTNKYIKQIISRMMPDNNDIYSEK